VESKDLAKLEPIDIYIAGEKFTLEPREYVVSRLSLHIACNTHMGHITKHTLYTQSCIKITY